jgi:C_GCAxxG_C_C family probable redox protein
MRRTGDIKMKMTLEEARGRVFEYLRQGNHCGPSMLKTMWEAYGLENEDLLWSGAALRGGIGGQQKATCGAVAAAAVALGLRHITPSGDKEKFKEEWEAAAEEAGELANDFVAKFGTTVCLDLVGVDLSVEGAFEEAIKSGRLDLTCHQFIPFIVGKLYEIEEKRGRTG